MALQEALEDRNALARGSGKPPLSGGSGGAGFSTGPPTPPEIEDFSILMHGGGLIGPGLLVFLIPYGSAFDPGLIIAFVEYRSPKSGTIQNGKILVVGNTLTAGAKSNITVEIRVNGIAVLSTTISVGSTADVDFSGTGSVTIGDDVTVSVDTTGTGGGNISMIVTYEVS